LSICRVAEWHSASLLSIKQADCQSAIQQAASLRYENTVNRQPPNPHQILFEPAARGRKLKA
jgi:hypothetical protein